MPETTPRKVLVVANETLQGAVLHDVLVTQRDSEILVVAPALNTPIRHLVSGEERAGERAAERLAACLQTLADAGVPARGYVGDADPLRAIDDALATFAADELLIATHPERRSDWLADDLIGRACARFSLPTAHIVIEPVRAHARFATAA